MSKRVLQVVTYMGRGGLETMLMNYYRHIDRSKVQFDFLTHRSFEADYDREITALGGKIYHLPRLNPLSGSYLRQLDAFFREHPEYRVVHSHLDCMAGIPLKYAERNGVPVRIAHAHNTNQEKNLKYPLKMLCRRDIPRYATDLFACSEAAGSWMFGKNRFSVINNAIDANQYAPDPAKRNQIRREFGIPDDALVLGHVGRFMPVKNHEFLLKVLCELKAVDDSCRLLLVGDGPNQARIKEMAGSMDISDRVIFTGVRGDVPALLQAMDVFLFPSLFEGLPLALIEAQCSGLPCLKSEFVPEESVKVPAIVRSVELAKGPKEWASAAQSLARIIRTGRAQEITDAGFNILEEARKLESFYLSAE